MNQSRDYGNRVKVGVHMTTVPCFMLENGNQAMQSQLLDHTRMDQLSFVALKSRT